METEVPSANKQGGLEITIFLTACMALIALFFYLCLTEGTWEFMTIGVVWSMLTTLMIAVFVLPVVAVMAFIIGKLLLNKGLVPLWINHKSVGAFGICLIVFGISSGLYKSMPQVRFADCVGQGEYQVSDVQVTGFNSFLASRWLFSFRVESIKLPSLRLNLSCKSSLVLI